VTGLGLTKAQLDLLLSVDADIWRQEAALIPPFYEKFGDRTPAALWAEYDALVQRLNAPVRKPAMAAAG
jgi:phosphoenolpyruvate carboxykinase (GTP)